ncbi:MAG: glutamate--cysteine ligase [Alphaproteobacteria bacterium]|nr:glutamate--cysteine ligase [Alphaproteobacteria bacterium]
MSAPATGSNQPLTDKRQLVEFLAAGCKPPSNWRIGTEHEKFAFTTDDLRPLRHDGERGVRALLEGMTRFGWSPVIEDGNLIALTREGGGSITLEPGGQLELSGAPLETIHQTAAEIATHLEEVRQVAGPLGIGMLGLGFQPRWRREDVPWMPKERYRIMRDHMPKVGSLGLDMMLRTCTVQVNLDFASESDMVRKFRVGLALQPIATALWANSPFVDGRPSGYLSYRSHVWTDTDSARCGILPFVFEPGMGFERYVDYALDVPMYFVYRGGRHVDASGQSFRDFMAGRLPACPGLVPTETDWANHLTTAFPEVRLKRFLEMRGADGGPLDHLCALPSLWTGLLYSTTALDEACELVEDWTPADHAALRRDVPQFGLATPFRAGTVCDVARRMVAIAGAGLRQRNRRNDKGEDESLFLAPLLATIESGRTPAEGLLESYHGRWGESVDPVFTEFAY